MITGMKIQRDKLAKTVYTKMPNGFSLEWTGRSFFYFKPGVLMNKVTEDTHLVPAELDDMLHSAMTVLKQAL